jgi:hypothetical protein
VATLTFGQDIKLGNAPTRSGDKHNPKTNSTFRQQPIFGVTPAKFSTFKQKFWLLGVLQAILSPVRRSGGSTNARVMRDPCQISISIGGCVTRDCRFERNTTVSRHTSKLHIVHYAFAPGSPYTRRSKRPDPTHFIPCPRILRAQCMTAKD